MNLNVCKNIIINKFGNVEGIFNYDNLKIVGISFIIFIVFMILRKIFTKYIFKIILKIFDKVNTEINKKIFLAFERPLNIFFIILGIYFSIKYFRIQKLGSRYYSSVLLENFLSTSLIILVAWGFYNIFKTSSVMFRKIKDKYDFNVDSVLIPFISKIIRFLIIAIAFIMIIEKWGYDIQGFIAGLGLGGLAIALAAKDAAANILGGLVILLDKPFSIGDWITANNIDGIIEDISFRSTRVRTFDEGVVTVPNSLLANNPITNWSRRGKRKVKLTIGVTYDTTPQKIKICVEKIKEMLKEHSEVNKDAILVNFDTFNSSSLDIMISYYINTSNLNIYLEIKQDINFKIMNILEEENVSMAFPSTSIYFENAINSINKEYNEVNNKSK